MQGNYLHTSKALICLIGLPLLACCASKEPPRGNTRAGLIAGFQLVLETNDTDADGRLSTSELQTMIALALPDDQQSTRERLNIRQLLLDDYAIQDTDRDGYLTLAELLKEPLETFTCMDTDNDDFLSQDEFETEMAHCDNGRPLAAH